MKNLRLTILTVVLLAATAFSATAQTKLATVDLKKIFTGYWKTKQADAALSSRTSELRKELKDMADGLDKAQTAYKQLLDQANDPAISAAERDKRKSAAADKERELATGKSSLDQFQRQADAQLSDQSQRMRSNLLTEIQKAVADKAKAGGYTLVVNSDANEAFVYVSPDMDITDAVLAQLNAGAPLDLNKAPSTPAFNISTNLP
ncbi:MAG TPA: OmpH family outer membrane protein [Verrucomicrobiae bacterium]|jgi:outer membrane protein|nr:OmpH family outer membrane protein [Verrucomicrobiae bacterium]